jgi:hypothetical protein
MFFDLKRATGCSDREGAARRIDGGIWAGLPRAGALDRAVKEDLRERMTGGGRAEGFKAGHFVTVEKPVLIAKDVSDASGQTGRNVVVPVLHESWNEGGANLLLRKGGVSGALRNSLPGAPHRQTPMGAIAHGRISNVRQYLFCA